MKKYFVMSLLFLVTFINVDAWEKISFEEFLKPYAESSWNIIQKSEKNGLFKYILIEPNWSLYKDSELLDEYWNPFDDNSGLLPTTSFSLSNYESSEKLTPNILKKMSIWISPSWCSNTFKYRNKKAFIYQTIICNWSIKHVKIITTEHIFTIDIPQNEELAPSLELIKIYVKYFIDNYKKISYEKKKNTLSKDKDWVFIKTLEERLSDKESWIFTLWLNKKTNLYFEWVLKFKEEILNEIEKDFEIEILRSTSIEILSIKFGKLKLSLPLQEGLTNGLIGAKIYTTNNNYYQFYKKNITKEDILWFLEYMKDYDIGIKKLWE